ncbi:hypothetical protein MLD38_020321 [Melastoma candidum]|uniref:Uncharacterized protein n=1 Tax=Melastoma candidum TaxID=119954 RepID=A0ACB9QDS2_9MYRT|nr:hypothetical protein MLD38_020321 [Melastoma candidum]
MSYFTLREYVETYSDNVVLRPGALDSRRSERVDVIILVTGVKETAGTRLSKSRYRGISILTIMLGRELRKVPAAKARSHTRKSNNRSPASNRIMPKLLTVAFAGFLAWAYKSIQPPEPTIVGAPGGPPVTGPRILLRDGRHLAYKEHGAPRDSAKHKIVFVHGFHSCRHDAVIANLLSQELFDELGIYIVSFDRPGYGESDPDQKRTPKSLALDIEELADQLGLGSRFYVVGFSMGGQVVWGCLKYIPQRLAGASLIAPVVNYWWPAFPSNLSLEAYYEQLPQDQWAVRVAHYVPWLTYWWNTQKWFPYSSPIARNPKVFSTPDMSILMKHRPNMKHVAQVRQQGDYVSLHRDMMVGFGTWEFDPMDLENPFPNGEGSVHLWQGDDDLLVPVTLQRYIAQRLPWIKYHELPGTGHLIPMAEGMSDKIVKALLLEEIDT